MSSSTVMPTTSSSYLSSSVMENNNHPDRQTFQKFFEFWMVEQEQHRQQLVSATKHRHGRRTINVAANQTTASEDEVETVLIPLIDRVMKHYEHYYSAKSKCAKQDVFGFLSPSWLSSLEDAFLWIGGWRPSMAFHLLYSKSGLQLEAIPLHHLINGISTDDLADLSPRQLVHVDGLQQSTIKEEKKITEMMAKHQETVADASMVELSHMVTELIMLKSSHTDSACLNGGGAEVEKERVDTTLALKEEGLEVILQRADDLRLRTLEAIVNDVLTPTQAVHFLIAAAELHLRLHDWGKKREAQIRCPQNSTT
ncbi:protein DOG1-like 4 [Ziziphus jujuba]|uniref:Protein DOG1-like 4 n=1 Tax=Ziziphus jujuba TaxID=326968 RepID=A0A6P4A8P0_ZIZJJ|nr:protein DOG1-like 4 [Ziziphus jujuba]